MRKQLDTPRKIAASPSAKWRLRPCIFFWWMVTPQTVWTWCLHSTFNRVALATSNRIMFGIWSELGMAEQNWYRWWFKCAQKMCFKQNLKPFFFSSLLLEDIIGVSQLCIVKLNNKTAKSEFICVGSHFDYFMIAPYVSYIWHSNRR